jgi:hypothetical protein
MRGYGPRHHTKPRDGSEEFLCMGALCSERLDYLDQGPEGNRQKTSGGQTLVYQMARQQKAHD